MLLHLETNEATDMNTEWMLPPELEPGQSAPLGISLVGPQLAGEANHAGMQSLISDQRLQYDEYSSRTCVALDPSAQWRCKQRLSGGTSPASLKLR